MAAWMQTPTPTALFTKHVAKRCACLIAEKQAGVNLASQITSGGRSTIFLPERFLLPNAWRTLPMAFVAAFTVVPSSPEPRAKRLTHCTCPISTPKIAILHAVLETFATQLCSR
jgi:hypothetical protein